jgi:phosphatidylinositol glycan class B
MKEKYIYLFSILILVVTAFFSTGYHHIDEHIQLLEFAGLKLGRVIPENLPWEFHYEIRPSIQPAIVVIVYRFFEIFGFNNPFFISFFMRLLSAVLAFTAMYFIYKAYINTIINESLKKCFLLLTFFLWFSVYESVRFSSENWSGNIFIIAFSLFVLKPSSKYYFYLIIGFLLGLSFLFRYQTGFLITGLILWNLFIKKDFVNTFLLVFGVLILVFIGILIDYWFYGQWTLTAWNYFDQNIIQNKVSNFGTELWWFYFDEVFNRAIPPFSIIFILCPILYFIFKTKDLLTWTLFPFLFIHFIIGHKEIRFLFPIIGFLPILIIKSIELINEKWKEKLLEKKLFKLFVKGFIITNMAVLLVVIFKPANDQISLFSKIYSDYKQPTVLNYMENNPYKNIFFYKRNNLEVKKIESLQQIQFIINKKQLLIDSTDKYEFK